MDGERLLDLLIKEGADYVEVRFHRNVEVSGLLKNGDPEPPEYLEIYGAGIRVIKGGSLAFASTNILEWESLKATGLKALRMAEACVENSARIKFSEEPVINKRWCVEFKENPTKVEVSSILEILRSVDSSIMELKGASFPNRLLSFGGSVEEKECLNSEGTRIYSKVPRVGGYFILTAFEGGKGSMQRALQFGESGGWERARSMCLEDVARSEGQAMVRMLLEGRCVVPDRYDVVVGGEVSGIIAHEGCGHPQEADRIMGREGAQAGESYVKRDMIGRRIGSPVVNVSDLPSLPNSYGFYLYDDEGVEVRKKRLIVGGVINEFLHNRETACEFGVKSNGAARATMYSREPIIRMSNTFIEPGDYSLEELLEGVRHGLYIKSFREWNIDDIRWNNRYVGFESYLVENGEIGPPVLTPVIEATTEIIFSSIDAVGKDLMFKAATCGKGQPDQGAPVWTGGPSMRMRGLYIKVR